MIAASIIAVGAGFTPSAAVALGQPVMGGGGFDDAPLLKPGIHTDTILPRETLFYAVALREGQRVRVRATIDVGVSSRSVQDLPDAGRGFHELSIFTPLRQRLPSNTTDDSPDDDFESKSIEETGPRVRSSAVAGRAAPNGENWTGPGVYHLAVVLSRVGSDLGATVELPLRLAIDVDGPSRPSSSREVSPGPLGDTGRGAKAGERQRAARGPDAPATSVGAGFVGGAALLALLLGLGAGYAGVSRRSRSAR